MPLSPRGLLLLAAVAALWGGCATAGMAGSYAISGSTMSDGCDQGIYLAARHVFVDPAGHTLYADVVNRTYAASPAGDGTTAEGVFDSGGPCAGRLRERWRLSPGPAGTLVGRLESTWPTRDCASECTVVFEIHGRRLKTTDLPSAPGPSPEPPRLRRTVDVGRAPTKGPADAPVTIVEFADFQCPFCSRAERTLRQIQSLYGDEVRLIWKNLPLAFHVKARPAAKAAVAAGLQGRFWDMHDLLFASSNGAMAWGDEKFSAWAGDLGLNVDKFRSDLASQFVEDAVSEDESQAQAVGAQGTPTFYINGWQLLGAQPCETFRHLIDQELTAKGRQTPTGARCPPPPPENSAPVPRLRPGEI